MIAADMSKKEKKSPKTKKGANLKILPEKQIS